MASVLMLACQALTAVSAMMIAASTVGPSKVAEDPATVASQRTVRPPKLRIEAAQIWIAGKGRPFDANNKLPGIIAGQQIDGSLDVNNVGGEVALVSASDLVVRWLDRLPMQNPIWEDHVTNSAKPTQIEAALRKTDLDNTHISIGGSRRWSFGTTVPTDIGSKKLFLIGQVSYADRAGSQHTLRFVRWYVPDHQRFARLEKADDDYEMDE